MKNSTNPLQKDALTTRVFALFLEMSALHVTPLPAKQNTTPARGNIGHTHLSKAAKEQLITNNTSWFGKIKQNLSPAVIWNF
jgi:hypothetical protein